MSVQNLEYQLHNGFINNWLVAGPLPRSVSISGSPTEVKDRKLQAIHEVEDPALGVFDQPVDRKSFEIAGASLTWRYFRCSEDHLVDGSAVFPAWQHLRTWAYARLVVKPNAAESDNAASSSTAPEDSTPDPAAVKFALFVSGPAQVWLNGRPVFAAAGFESERKQYSFEASLRAENELLVRFEQVCLGPCANQMALKIAELPAGLPAEAVSVQVPTNAKYPYRQQQFERLFDCAYLDTMVSERGTQVNLHWAEDTKEEMRYQYQIQDAEERIYIEGTWDPDPGSVLDIGHPQRIFERQLWVVLRAIGREYFEQNMRYERRLPIYIQDNEFSEQPYGDPATRRQEALEDAARREGNLFGEIAKMTLGKWDKLDTRVLQASIAQVEQGQFGWPAQAAGLLSILYRFAGKPEFPAALKEPLEDCLLGLPAGPVDFSSESQSILFFTCEALAGQFYPDREFDSFGRAGRELQSAAEKDILAWLTSRGRGGFMEWDSNSAFEVNITALSLLTSLSQSEAVRELSAVLLDKILFLMAVNSYKGVYGSTHGVTTADMIRSARLEATSGITRLLWGMGVFSQYIMGVVSLACSEYEYPSFFADIAARLPKEQWSKERHVASPDALSTSAEVNKVAYKTPDYMLSSAQDYRPGQKGSQEHIWQATLGPDAVVFANHPASMQDGPAHRPGFWLGNAVLPRVAQWKDVLISIHQLPADDWMGFTHAYFPTYAFDEYELKDGWAFARKGTGYLAITARQGMELVKHSPDGYRELRSYGLNNIWLCQMGRDDQDGDFSTFKKDVLKIKPRWKDLSVRFTSLRGEKLSFGWQGPLQVNGQAQPITGFKHIDNPFCTADLPANHMDISFDELLLRLNFQE